MARRRIYRTPGQDKAGSGEPLHTPLDRTRIVSAGLLLLHKEGLEQITMRKIADSLGVKAAALYYHVKDKEQLLHLLAERISSEITYPDPRLSWQHQLREWSLSFRRTLLRYRDAGRIMEATLAASPNRLEQIEFLFRLFAEAGFQDSQIPWLSGMLKNHILGFAEEEKRLADRAERERMAADGSTPPAAERFQSLDGKRYPHIARLASSMAKADWDDEFMFGIDVLLAGFEARL